MHIYLQIFGVIAVILTLLAAVDVALRLSEDAHVRGLVWAPVMFAVIAGACFVGAHLLEGCSCT